MSTPQEMFLYSGINQTVELYSYYQRMRNNMVLNLELGTAEANCIVQENKRQRENVLAPERKGQQCERCNRMMVGEGESRKMSKPKNLLKENVFNRDNKY